MLVLYYFNWTGNSNELEEFIERVKDIYKTAEGISFKGLYIPNSEWNYAMLYETKSFDKALEAFRNGIKEYGDKWQSGITISKNEILYTPHELGFPNE